MSKKSYWDFNGRKYLDFFTGMMRETGGSKGPWKYRISCILIVMLDHLGHLFACLDIFVSLMYYLSAYNGHTSIHINVLQYF